MPIRFRCKRCRQLLGIASRKAGSHIECPKCGISQVVPGEDAASAALAMDQFAKNAVSVEEISDFVVYEDQPAAIETPRPGPAEDAAPPVSGEPSPGAPPIQTSGEAGRPVPRGMILFPRRVFYVQGLLFLVVALAAFGAGYFIGRGDANYGQMIARKEAARQRTQIPITAFYDRPDGTAAGDQGAVVIVLPEGNPLARDGAKRIPSDGVRPRDPVLSEPPRSILLIRRQLGEFARAKASGEFDLAVPDKGTYHLLVISRNTARPRDSAIDELDFSEMKEYFSSPEDLIGDRKYEWRREEVNAGLSPIEVRFGRDSQR